MAEALLTLENILLRYGDDFCLDVASFSVERGEIHAVIGPNGAGKSTLLRVLGLLQQPAHGKVYFRGQEIIPANGLAIRRRMASVFQEPLLLNASVYENAALGLKLRGLDRRAAEQRVLPWLERLGISQLAKRQARSLSGGEAQRTSLARALAIEPEILLLDEPFSPLDPPKRESLLYDLERILRETGVTTVFVTHDRDEAFMLGDRISVLMDGRLLQTGPATEVYAHPVNEEVAHFVGIDTKIPGVVEFASDGLAQVRIDGGGAQVVGDFAAGERVLLCLRPEDITLSLAGDKEIDPGSRNRLRGKVLAVAPSGAYYRVTVACGEIRLVAFIIRPSFLELRVAEGDEVVASFTAPAVHVIRQS
jgi:tungstate transport system ATP-binding protein